MKQRTRPLNKKLELSTYANDKVVTFSIAGGQSPSEDAFSPVRVPLPLMYRLYHLGRAYDLPRIIALHPNGMFIIDYVQLQSLGLELELLSGIISDPALSFYIDMLLDLVTETRTATRCQMLVKAE